MLQAPVKRHHPEAGLNTNARLIYQLVRQHGSISRADIVRQIDLTFPSVSRITGELLELGILGEGGRRRGGIGKPPTELSIHPESAFSLGVHQEGSQSHAVLANALGEPLKHTTFSTPLVEQLKGMLKQAGVTPNKLLGVGVTRTGEAVDELEVKQLSDALDVQVLSAPAIAASVQTERYFGQARQTERFVYYDALHHELGAMVGAAILAHSDTLTTLLDAVDPEGLQERDLFAPALKAATAVLQAEALIVNATDDKSFSALQASMPALKVIRASPEASNEAQAAATLPVYDTYSVL